MTEVIRYESMEQFLKAKTSAQFISEEDYQKVYNHNLEALKEWCNRISQAKWNVDIIDQDTTLEIKEIVDQPFFENAEHTEELKRTYGYFITYIVRTQVENEVVEQVKKMIGLSPRLIKHNLETSSNVEKILMHELCHAFIYETLGNAACQDFAPPFEAELIRIGAVSQLDIMTGNFKPIVFKSKNRK